MANQYDRAGQGAPTTHYGYGNHGYGGEGFGTTRSPSSAGFEGGAGNDGFGGNDGRGNSRFGPKGNTKSYYGNRGLDGLGDRIALMGPDGEHFKGKGPLGYQRSDERLREQVCELLTQDEQVDASAIEVTVEHGEVTLSGEVDDRRARRRAEECLDGLSGIKQVFNRLRPRSR